METLKLTEQEAELITAIRNYKKSMHNPSFQLEEYANRCYEILMYED
jgi:hypothetical protein